jgi:hypothetical protein
LSLVVVVAATLFSAFSAGMKSVEGRFRFGSGLVQVRIDI